MSSEEVLITRKIEIDMGHRVPNHKSKCSNLHGHRYVFEVGVKGPLCANPGESDEGMVLDYGDLKELLVEHIDKPFDHGFMMYEGDSYAPMFRELKEQKIIFVPFIPTAENIARHVFYSLKPECERLGIALAQVRLWETPNCSALYPPSGAAAS